MAPTISIIDFGIGNICSVENAFAALQVQTQTISSPDKVAQCDALVLPGVGAFGEGIKNLRERGFEDALTETVIVQRKPVLGICLGMQFFAESSEELGSHIGLSWIPGQVRRLPESSDIKVPHVGWNTLQLSQREPLFNRITGEPHVYFDHSYRYECDQKYISASCTIGTAGESIAAAVQRDNIFGVQFHPEKSQNTGLRILRAFVNYASNEAHR